MFPHVGASQASEDQIDLLCTVRGIGRRDD